MRYLSIPILFVFAFSSFGVEGELGPRASGAVERFNMTVEKAEEVHAQDLTKADAKLAEAIAVAKKRVVSDLLKSITSRDGFAAQARVHRAVLSIEPSTEKSREFFAAMGTLDTVLAEINGEAPPEIDSDEGDPLGRLAGGEDSGEPPQNSAEAIDAALRFFQRHQSPGGMWDVDGYSSICTGTEPKAEPGTGHAGLDGDVAMTGLILISFLRAGHVPGKAGPYRETIDSALSWLVATQEKDGSFGKSRNYENAIATWALLEARILVRSNRGLAQASEKGLRFLISRQSREGGWNYTEPDEQRQDLSVTTWVAHALNAAKRARLTINAPMGKVNTLLNAAWASVNDKRTIDPKKGWASFPYTWNSESKEGNKTDRSALGLSIAASIGRKASDPIVITLANSVVDPQAPVCAEGRFNKWPMNPYWAYHASSALKTIGGSHLEDWRKMVLKPILENQRTEGCRKGSWSSQGTDFHGDDTGPLFVTALCTLSLLELAQN